jgi:hypothetical protein
MAKYVQFIVQLYNLKLKYVYDSRISNINFPVSGMDHQSDNQYK